MKSPFLSATAPALACLAALACDPSAGTGPARDLTGDPSGVVFLAQEAVPAGYMEALFQGRVLRDANGCLRLDEGERATVVWPLGYKVEARGIVLVVKDEQGREVGTIGGSFRLGGGWVGPLNNVQHLSAEARAQAEESCPGSYFVASPDR